MPALVPAAKLNEPALQIALMLRHPVYGCMYLACAELAAAPLVTDDRRFLRALGTGAWRDKVIALDAISALD